MKRAVVTGASGFIGHALTKRLLSEGWTVYALVRCQDSLADLDGDLRQVVCDFAGYDRLADMVGEDVDWFLHFAWAGVSGEKSRSVAAQVENVTAAVEAMTQAERLHAAKFLFAGSSYQYRMEPSGDVYLPKNLYGAAKAAAERLLWAAALADGMAFNTVLFTNVFGVGDRSNRSTNAMLKKFLAGEPLQLISGEHLHDWTYIDDAVSGVMAVLEKGEPGKEYYIGSRSPMTFKDIVTRARDAVGSEAELLFGAYEDDAYIDYTKIDLDALFRDTGYACTAGFDESIRKTASWLAGEKNMTEHKAQKTYGGGVTPSSTYIVVTSALFAAFAHVDGQDK